MITELTMYGVQCDNCGADWMDEHSGFAALIDESSMRNTISDDTDWHTEHSKEWPDKHYCPKCFGGFDDNDKLIIKQLSNLFK